MQNAHRFRFEVMEAMNTQKANMLRHHEALSRTFNKMPFVGKPLETTPPNIRQEGAMKALGIITMLGIFNFADQSVPSAVKTLFADDLNMSDAESSYPVAAMVINETIYLFLYQL